MNMQAGAIARPCMGEAGVGALYRGLRTRVMYRYPLKDTTENITFPQLRSHVVNQNIVRLTINSLSFALIKPIELIKLINLLS